MVDLLEAARRQGVTMMVTHNAEHAARLDPGAADGRLEPVQGHDSLWRLVTRSARFYWKTGVVVAAAVAIATAVITGSLVVGASVTGSLRDTALARLGRVDHALVAPRHFRAALASALQRSCAQAGVRRVVPVLLAEGAVADAEGNSAAA